MAGVTNDAGERVFECSSDAEAARWWLESGRRGDTLTDTGEDMADVCDQLGIADASSIRFDRSGCVEGLMTGADRLDFGTPPTTGGVAASPQDRPPGMLSTREVLKVCDGKVTYRQADHWHRVGAVRLSHELDPGSGHYRWWTPAEAVALRHLGELLAEFRSGELFDRLVRQARSDGF